MTFLNYYNPKTGREVEIDDSNFNDNNPMAIFDRAAKDKGYVQELEMEHPQKGKKFIPITMINQALDKGWNTSSTIQAQNMSDKDVIGTGTAAALGVSQGLTFGLGDEMAGVGKVLQKRTPDITGTPLDLIGGVVSTGIDALTEQGRQKIQNDYTQARDNLRNDQKLAEEQHKGAFLTGKIGSGLVAGIGAGIASGGVKTALAAAPEGANIISRIGHAGLEGVKAGMGYGAAEGAGESEGNLTSVDKLGELSKDVGYGAAGGAVMGGLLGAGGKTLGEAWQGVTSGNARKGLEESIIGLTKNEKIAKNTAAYKGKNPNYGSYLKTLDDEGFFGGVATKQDLAAKAQKTINLRENELQEVLGKNKTILNTNDIDRSASEEFINSLPHEPQRIAARNKINAFYEKFQNGTDLKTLNQEKRDLTSNLSKLYGKEGVPNSVDPVNQLTDKAIADDLRQTVEQTMFKDSSEGKYGLDNLDYQGFEKANSSQGANLWARNRLVTDVANPLHDFNLNKPGTWLSNTTPVKNLAISGLEKLENIPKNFRDFNDKSFGNYRDNGFIYDQNPIIKPQDGGANEEMMDLATNIPPKKHLLMLNAPAERTVGGSYGQDLSSIQDPYRRAVIEARLKNEQQMLNPTMLGHDSESPFVGTKPKENITPQLIKESRRDATTEKSQNIINSFDRLKQQKSNIPETKVDASDASQKVINDINLRKQALKDVRQMGKEDLPRGRSFNPRMQANDETTLSVKYLSDKIDANFTDPKQNMIWKARLKTFADQEGGLDKVNRAMGSKLGEVAQTQSVTNKKYPLFYSPEQIIAEDEFAATGDLSKETIERVNKEVMQHVNKLPPGSSFNDVMVALGKDSMYHKVVAMSDIRLPKGYIQKVKPGYKGGTNLVWLEGVDDPVLEGDVHKVLGSTVPEHQRYKK